MLLSTSPAATSGLPALHSDPVAPATIYLDFNGASSTSWNNQTVPATPAYDTDGNPANFSAGEIGNIRQIWQRVAEKFSPFNLDVTTEDPGAVSGRKTLRVVVGGDGSWATGADGGLSQVGSFASGDATVWVFSKNLNNGDPKETAETIAHESGHALGLVHQSIYSANTLVAAYNSGNGFTAPIMGESYDSIRGLWWRGPDSNSPTEIQDDMAVIAGARNGFGYRPQDHGQSPANADPMAVRGKALSGEGVIESTSDTDYFSFHTGNGAVSIKADVAPFGPMLHLKLTLIDGAGQVVATASGPSLGQSLKARAPAGTYFVEVSSYGDYGDVGQYTITGTLAGSATRAAGKASLKLTANATSNRVRLKWSDRSLPTGQFQVQRSTDGGTTWQLLATTAPGASAYLDTAVSSGTTVSYRVLPASLPTDQPSGVAEVSIPVRHHAARAQSHRH